MSCLDVLSGSNYFVEGPLPLVYNSVLRSLSPVKTVPSHSFLARLTGVHFDMRYEDWDVLIFPSNSAVPLQEFKTECHVVRDHEFGLTTGSYGLPTLTCFVPGLEAGTPFNISLHSWGQPEPSEYTQAYSQHPESCNWEARVFVDGRLLSTSFFHRESIWPQLLSRSFAQEFTKKGDLEPLRFPRFRPEFLRPEYRFNPADDLGRIKIVISEGFPRDSATFPIERVKNTIAFSFVHAPSQILENVGIAWPNAKMWQRNQPSNSSLVVPTQLHEGGPQTHVHSPRRQGQVVVEPSSSFEYPAGSAGWTATQTSSFLNNMPQTQAFVQGGIVSGGSSTDTNYMDLWNAPHSESSYNPPISHWPIPHSGTAGHEQPVHPAQTSYNASLRHKTSKADKKLTNSDSSMPDYPGTYGGSFDQMNPLDQFDFQNIDPISKDHDTALNSFQMPNNTPTKWCALNSEENSVATTNRLDGPGQIWEQVTSQTQRAHDTPGMLHNRKLTNVFNPVPTRTPPPPEFDNRPGRGAHFPTELAASLTQSLLNQPSPLSFRASYNTIFPAGEVKSRKDSRLEDTWLHRNASVNISARAGTRKTSQATLGQRHDSFNQVQLTGSSCDKESEKSPTRSPSSSARTFSAFFSQSSESNREFGNDLTNANCIVQSDRDASTPKKIDAISAVRLPSEGLMGPGSDKGTKRSRRQHSPANPKPLDDGEQGLGTALAEISCFDDNLIE